MTRADGDGARERRSRARASAAAIGILLRVRHVDRRSPRSTARRSARREDRVDREHGLARVEPGAERRSNQLGGSAAVADDADGQQVERAVGRVGLLRRDVDQRRRSVPSIVDRAEGVVDRAGLLDHVRRRAASARTTVPTSATTSRRPADAPGSGAARDRGTVARSAVVVEERHHGPFVGLSGVRHGRTVERPA